MLHVSKLLVAVVAAAMLGLSGCASLPRSGPDDRNIREEATIYIASTKGHRPELPYALVDLTGEVLSYFPAAGPQSLHGGFGATRRGPPTLPLGNGDIVEVTIFESSAGGLFVPAEAGSRPGNFITLPRQTIDSNGTITVPYAGRIEASGKLPEQVQADIERRLAARAIEPQAVINVIESRSTTIAVLGDVKAAAKIDLDASGQRVLDAISAAGGISSPGPETNITLQRNNTTATVPFETLVSNPRENIFVYPGDTVYVNRERRTYLAFGASGLSGRIDFEESNLTLAEAVGKAGGLLDERADPGQVFLYRLVDAETANKLGVPVTAKADGGFPIIFRVNMRDPSGFFIARQFRMQDQDILYVSNANSVEVQKFFDVLNSVTTGVAGPAIDAASIRTSARTLR